MTWVTIVLAATLLCCGLTSGQTLEELQQLQELFEQAVAAGTTPKPGSGGQVPGSGGQFPDRPVTPSTPPPPPVTNRPPPPPVTNRPPPPPVTNRPPPPAGGGGGQGSSSGGQGCRYFCKDRNGRYVPCC